MVPLLYGSPPTVFKIGSRCFIYILIYISINLNYISEVEEEELFGGYAFMVFVSFLRFWVRRGLW